jgi:hypothetical protein
MSGFLERLAAGVLHSQRAVHPSVGMIWSAPGMTEQSAAAEPIETSGEVLVPPSPRRAHAQAPQAAQPLTQPPAKPQMQPKRSSGDAQAPPEAELSTQQPPRLQETDGEAVIFRPLVALPQRSAFSATHDAHEIAEKSEPILPARLHQTRGEPNKTSPKPPRLTESPRLPASAPRMPAPAAERRASTEPPDSIEIHIGRIEVLAAPPRPAQPAAPAPARKSLDLGEYLRGERRAR